MWLLVKDLTDKGTANGVFFCLWFSEEPSPCSWNDSQGQIQEEAGRMAQPGPPSSLSPSTFVPENQTHLLFSTQTTAVPLSHFFHLRQCGTAILEWKDEDRGQGKVSSGCLETFSLEEHRQTDSVESHPRASHMSRWGVKSCSKSSSWMKRQINPMEATPLPLGIYVRWRLLREWMNKWTFVLNH